MELELTKLGEHDLSRNQESDRATQAPPFGGFFFFLLKKNFFLMFYFIFEREADRAQAGEG